MGILLKNITKKYNPLSNSPPEIENVSFEIKDGEIFVLLGPSGCGKSTLLNLVAGFLEPTSGEIWMNDKKITGASWERGVIFQDTDIALFPWLNVKENIEFGLKMRGTKNREKILKEHLDLVNLAPHIHKYPHEISGGMKQRVQIARVLANDPGALLMDEPFANLDAQTRTKMQNEVIEIWSQTKKTILFVTHEIKESIIIGQRAAIMTAGPRATIKKIYKISLPYPRDLSAKKFINLHKKILKDISAEVVKSYQ